MGIWRVRIHELQPHEPFVLYGLRDFAHWLFRCNTNSGDADAKSKLFLALPGDTRSRHRCGDDWDGCAIQLPDSAGAVLGDAMLVSGWMRKWRDAHDDEEQGYDLVRAAARGDSLDHVLDLGLQALLATAAGDRAGLWLAQGRNGDSSHGRVIEAQPGPIPEQWKHLDISTPFLRSAFESQNPLRLELGLDMGLDLSGGQAMSQLGPLAGMRSAIWIPLRAGSHIWLGHGGPQTRRGQTEHGGASRARR